MNSTPFALAIHGGAGTILRNSMTPELQQQYEGALREALDAGWAILQKDGSSLDAVEAAVIVLENFPLFNAGKGAVFNSAGLHELDASIMRGDTGAAGAVCGVSGIRNPVSLARRVMEASDHVMMAGGGAEEFAKGQGFRIDSPEYFYTNMRHQQLIEAQKEDKMQLDHSDKKFGTVGAVALDASGNLAAATSTGGMTNKKWGRVGDSPIIGAGTWAKNTSCAVSCTGHGEYFIRTVVGHEVSCMMEYGGLSLKDAANKVVMGTLRDIGGEGGLIAVDAFGNISMPFNSEGMYRASRHSDGTETVRIYRED